LTFSELIVDEYFIEICRASKTDEVDFQEDGGWKEYYTPKEREKLEQRERSKKKDNAVVIHDITLADSGDEDEQANPTAGVSSGVEKLSQSANDDTIMILSSDDEDPNPPKRQR